MDLAETIVPRSDQINSEDLLTGPRTVTITAVQRGTDEQPVNIVTAEFGPARPYKPSKTMRRVLAAAWGTDAEAYIGRRLVIYRDPEITFGRDKVGGIRISAMSDIPNRLSLALTVTRGRRAPFIVEPLRDEPGKPGLISKAEAAEFERRIAEAASIKELDSIARDLKARELGAFHEHLLSVFSTRRTALTKPDPGQGGENDVSQGAEPSSGATSPPDSRDQDSPATPDQLARLNAIRQAEKWEADDEWHAYVQALTGTEVAADGQLTQSQAQQIIDEFNQDGAQ